MNMMFPDDAQRVTSAVAAAIEYISSNSSSALARQVIHELRAATALVGQSLTRELTALTDEQFFKLHVSVIQENTRREREPWKT